MASVSVRSAAGTKTALRVVGNFFVGEKNAEVSFSRASALGYLGKLRPLRV